MEVPDYRVVILGAGKNLRGSLPAALASIEGNRRLLDWLVAAFGALPEPEINFVSGFMAQEVMRHYRNIHFHHNPDWEQTGAAQSLALAPLSSQIATYVCYSDVVFRKDIVQRMESEGSNLVIALDRQWKTRYDGRSDSELEDAEKITLSGDIIRGIERGIPVEEAHAEYAGIFRLSGDTASRLENVLGSSIFDRHDGIPKVLSFLLQHEVRVGSVDVEGEWAELNAPQDLARFVLGTKAESLERLRPLLKTGHILDGVRFRFEQFTQDPASIIQSIQSKFQESNVIIRSSSLSEDSWAQSSAGAFLSIPDVPSGNGASLSNAVEEVFESYGDTHPRNEVLVQEMLDSVLMSGVIMTRTHGQGAPYFVINYDETTGSTDSVTSGEGSDLRTVYLHRDSAPPETLSPNLLRVLETVREIEQLVGYDSLDIEFAITADDVVQILQVRPIAMTHEGLATNDEAIREGLRAATRFMEALQTPSAFMLGDFTQLSVMSDWNPAEIIGTKPGRLAFSIYRYIITDETWARQRMEYGYRDVRPANLLVSILGHPYIDVRASFNSFCPAALDDRLAKRLIEHQLRKLEEHPELHDKVEFDVLLTCWSFDIDAALDELQSAGFSADELTQTRSALLEITRDGIKRCASDHAALDGVSRRFEQIRDSDCPPLEKAYLFLENAREYGALHFSHLARGAFVAVTLLKSLTRKGILSEENRDQFLASLRTVSSQLQGDAAQVQAGSMPWEAFVEEYGHLRPGTYDINSRAYAQAPEEFLRPIVSQESTRSSEDSAFSWPPECQAAIDSVLQAAGLDVSFSEFEEFLRLSIEGREYGKFIFTRDLSAALEAIAAYGADHFISREQLSHIDIHDLLALRSAGLENPSVVLRRLAAQGSGAFHVSQAACLPDQVFRTEDFYCFEFQKTSPNYVTRKKVRSRVVALTSTSGPDVEIEDAIVVIPNADPGFDWIFSRNISGLITMYGGANSHMAIRMAEFDLPGVTGVGELIYEQIRRAAVIELDCAGRQIRIVR